MSRKRSNVVQLRSVEDTSEHGSRRPRAPGIPVPVSPVQAALPALGAFRVIALEGDGAAARVRLDAGGTELDAAVDPSVDRVVIETALRHGERLIAQREASGWVVLGALRARGTPGVDALEEIALRAARVEIEGVHGVRLHSGATRLVLSAAGHVETVAETITSHARGIQKIVGRLLRLN